MKPSLFNHPVFSLRRTYLIARRDFFGYIKTWGFWLTTFGPFIGLLLFAIGSFAMIKTEPVSYAIIHDETGIHAPAIKQKMADDNAEMVGDALQQLSNIIVPAKEREEFKNIIDTKGAEYARQYMLDNYPKAESYAKLIGEKLVFLPPPSNDIEELKKYATGALEISHQGKVVDVNGVLHITDASGSLVTDYWSTSPNNNVVENLVNSYFVEQARDTYLGDKDLSMQGLREASISAQRVARFNPEKKPVNGGDQRVTNEDTLPYFVASALSLILWLTIFTGAYMLLVSMVEEKINKVLEMLLATTKFSEIFVGKLFGVAALTLTSLLPWIITGLISFYIMLNIGENGAVQDILSSIDAKMFIFLPVFLILGYLFYGAIFIALGAISESMQDASTLMTPMVLLMTVCLSVVPMGLSYPDSPMVIFGQWFPFSAPFAALVRLPSDPPLWHTIGSALSLLVSSILVIWLSNRVLQQGVLSGSGVSLLKGWFMRKVLRRTPSK